MRIGNALLSKYRFQFKLSVKYSQSYILLMMSINRQHMQRIDPSQITLCQNRWKSKLKETSYPTLNAFILFTSA